MPPKSRDRSSGFNLEKKAAEQNRCHMRGEGHGGASAKKELTIGGSRASSRYEKTQTPNCKKKEKGVKSARPMGREKGSPASIPQKKKICIAARGKKTRDVMRDQVLAKKGSGRS